MQINLCMIDLIQKKAKMSKKKKRTEKNICNHNEINIVKDKRRQRTTKCISYERKKI